MTRLTRRSTLGLIAAAGLVTPTILRAQDRNASSFTMQHWQDHFDSLGKGVIVCDVTSRALHFWSGDGQTYKVYPTSVPISEELTKRGRTEIVRKVEGPSWTPTQSMMERFPHYRPMGPGPDNPLGTHAMYLTWPAYLIHGTHDTRKIGRLSSDGCIGLYNEGIEELFGKCPIGTQVRII
ncbi:L,D-transpeptidase [Paracoccus aestuarii]|uniref:L,D-transpeptidase n=1 Tax=Paracoccus aestuarii TaxID=453842 RepID=A0A418ZUS5_9RHOB|nr:L,D-transpeptidase [Paracoccus aestuarii]RJL03353.1 L,D-transpeptidase [Paracoccus aestuarii]WCQ99254.1 L,D-transpeptidase [Paracoccus aestuarii]